MQKQSLWERLVGGLRFAIVTGVCCITVSACRSFTPADDLIELSAADTTCRVLPQDSARARRGVARMLMLQVGGSSRFVSVGVDATNQPRIFGAMVTRKAGNTMTMQSVNAVYDAVGRMSMATRTFTTREMPSGTGESKSVRLSDADTTKVRSLTAQVLRRCVR